MKRKLLLAALCVVGAIGMRAQTDVTSTYLTNADFEGAYSSYSQPQSERDIYQPEGWNISYSNGNENDMTALNSEDGVWNDNFSSLPLPTNGEHNTYWIRFPWGDNETLQLSQETSTELPAGTYCLSVDAYSNNTTSTTTISIAEKQLTVKTIGEWSNYKILFTLTSAQKVTVVLNHHNYGANRDAAVTAFDNIKLFAFTEEPADMLLKSDLGGTEADLSDFNVGDGDYTLEVEGTAGTEITIAADNISYTPEVTGTVRFVKKDGIAYVYEGTSYKTVVESEKAAYTYATMDASSVSGDKNILKNGTFKIKGELISDGKWKLGEPWVFEWGNANIRVEANNRLVWRGTANDLYFSQPLSLNLKPYKGYQVSLEQADNGNAQADFNVGIGNAAGDYSYLSAQMRLGQHISNGIHAVELVTMNDIAETDNTYFTFRNTHNNTASSGTDPVTQIQWIALVESDAFPIEGATSASYIYGAAYAPAAAKNAYDKAKAEATTALDDDTYAVVTGEERTALQEQLNATVADYDTATDNIYTALHAFTDALSHYQAWSEKQAEAHESVPVSELKYASAEKKAFLTAKATNADDADKKVATMESNIRTLYESNAMAEGIADAVNLTSLLVNPNNPQNIDGWNLVNTSGNSKLRINQGESYTDADGTATHKYFDSDSWGSAFSSTFTQDVELPAGTYILTTKARGNGTNTYQVIAGEEATDITPMGNTGGIFGRGWNDYTVEFTLASKKTIALGINVATSSNGNWISFSDFRLVRIADIEAATVAEYEALNAAIAQNEGKTLGFDQGEYAPYNNIKALATLEEAKAVNQDEKNGKTYIEELTATLTAATWTANETDMDAIYNGLFATVAPGQNYPEGWVRTNNWGEMHSDIAGTYATAYYNQPGSMQYGTQGLYTMPLAANTWYKLTFAYRSNENNSNKSVTVSVLNGEGGLPATSFEANPSTSDWKEVEQVFQTGAAGNYVLTLANEGNTWMTNVSITKSAESAANMSVKAGKWGTFVAPFDVTIPEGVKAYKVTGVENEQIVKEEVEETIPANTPVVLLNEAEEDIEETVTGAGLPESETVTEGLLTGIYQAGADIPAESYVLQTQDGKQAFYHVAETFAGQGVANRCYLTMSAGSAPLRAIFFGSEEGTTGIEAAEATGAEDGILYNLAGQKVDASYKGIVIKKGKAMLKK